MRSVMALGAFLALAACESRPAYVDPYRDRDEMRRQPREVLREDGVGRENDYCLRNPGACRR